jgi:DNA-binding transcriptional ArsR family regulator
MVKKIGDALKQAITQEKDSEDERGRSSEESVLLNPTRLEMFQYLCQNPCSRIRIVARDLELAVTTVDWHLKKLSERGFITAKQVGKNRIYYPTEMVDSRDIEVLSLLRQDKAKLICSAVANNQGITQGELGKKVGMYQQEVGWYTSKLTEKSVLSRVKDGKYKRYYISIDLKNALSSNRDRRNLFKRALLRALKNDGANPEILRSRTDNLVIKIGPYKEKTILKVNLNLIPGFLQTD